MEDNKIKNSQIIGGFAYNGDYANFGSQNARLHNSRCYRGDPKASPSSSVIGINFGEEMVITAIATQGFGGSGVDEWVTSFNVFYKDSKGNQKFVKGIDGQHVVRVTELTIILCQRTKVTLHTRRVIPFSSI